VNIKTETFSVQELADFLEIPKRTVAFWVTAKLIRPSAVPSTGRGSATRFNFDDAIDCLVLMRISKSGLPYRLIKKWFLNN
jgi:DNA-binding transcriptional MerR regulator